MSSYHSHYRNVLYDGFYSFFSFTLSETAMLCCSHSRQRENVEIIMQQPSTITVRKSRVCAYGTKRMNIRWRKLQKFHIIVWHSFRLKTNWTSVLCVSSKQNKWPEKCGWRVYVIKKHHRNVMFSWKSDWYISNSYTFSSLRFSRVHSIEMDVRVW